jgi:hypothetical protein
MAEAESHNSLNCSLRATNVQDVQSPLEGSAMNTRDPLAGMVSRGAAARCPGLAESAQLCKRAERSSLLVARFTPA